MSIAHNLCLDGVSQKLPAAITSLRERCFSRHVTGVREMRWLRPQQEDP